MKKILAVLLISLLSLTPSIGAFTPPSPALAFIGNVNASPYSCPVGIPTCGQAGATTPTVSAPIPAIPAGVNTDELLEDLNLDALSAFTGEGTSGKEDAQAAAINNARCPSSQNTGGGLGNQIFNAIAGQADLNPELVRVLSGVVGENGQVDTGAILNAVLGNSGLGEQLGNSGVNVSGILNIVSSQGGGGVNLGGFDIGGLLGGVTGNSGGGILNTIGGLFGGGTGSGGGIINTIGGLFGGGAGSTGGIIETAGGLFGGGSLGGLTQGLGGIAGLAGGLLGGSAEVPSIDRTAISAQNAGNQAQERGNANTTVIKAETTELRIKECTTDVAVALAARRIAAESSAEIIRTIVEGPTGPVRNFAELDRTAYNSGKIAYIDQYNGPHRERVVEFLERQMAEEQGSGNETPVDCGEEGTLENLFNRGAFRWDGCSEAGSIEKARGEAERMGLAARESAQGALRPIQYRPQVEPCVVNGVTYEDIEHCPFSKILTPATDVQKLSQDAQAEGRALDRNADEPGELGEGADTALRMLTQTILGGFGGLVEGLTRRDRGASQSGSFLDRLRAEAEDVSLDAESGTLEGEITGTILREGVYQQLLQTSVDELSQTARVFDDLHACFAGLTIQPETLSLPVAQAALNASTTAHALKTEADQKKLKITDSRNVVSELSGLLSELGSGARGETSVVRDTFRSITDTNRTLTGAQLNALSIEARAATEALAVVQADARNQLATCGTYR
ncbi:hypothetical protein K2X83_02245 [Patescibacteria group bacterium]|nr:hypothetical protein [Patescibacteria group bacterium]